jgi:hypothetical protein
MEAGGPARRAGGPLLLLPPRGGRVGGGEGGPPSCLPLGSMMCVRGKPPGARPAGASPGCVGASVRELVGLWFEPCDEYLP